MKKAKNEHTTIRRIHGAMADTMPNEADELNRRTELLQAALSGEDDLGMVVRAHIVIEHELQEFVLLAAPNPSELKFKEMDYDEKVRLALVLGLDPELKAALKAAGTLRNRFSHKLEMKLGEQEAKNLFATLTPEHLKTLRTIYTPHLAKEQNQTLQGASVRDRVQMFFMLIFSQVFAQADARKLL